MKDELESDYVIITYGGLVAEAISLQEQLYMEDEISLHIISPSQLFPIDNDLIDLISDYKHIILLEESYPGASWSSEISAILSERKGHSSIHRFSTQLKTIAAAENLENSILPNVNDIADLIKDMENE
jgi:pyruvate/2-oxoglutarate/acetoin dehydrogenase E1 component